MKILELPTEDLKKQVDPRPILTLKQLTRPCGFSKNVFFKERIKPWFFVTFNIIISYILPEIFIEIPQVAQKI